MELIKVEKHELYEYATFLPETVLRHCKDIFVCVEGDSLYGAIALEDLDGYMNISWIWVEPEVRRKGIGTAMLTHACYFAKEQSSRAVTVAYDPENELSDVLQYMFAKLGFHLLMHKFESYCITKDDLLNSPIMKGFDIEKKHISHTRALEDISHKEFIGLMLFCEDKGLHFISRCDFSKADPKKTRLIVENDELRGIIIVNTTEIPGEYEVSVMFVDQAHSSLGVLLLRECVTEFLRDPRGFSSICFTCVVESSRRLAAGLFTNVEKSVKQMCEGVLETAMLRNGGGKHYGNRQ